MFEVGISTAGEVKVATTEYRGFSPEELAERATERIVTIAPTVEDPVVREQAEAFRSRIYHIILGMLQQAVVSDRTTLYNEFMKQGHNDMAEILRRL